MFCFDLFCIFFQEWRMTWLSSSDCMTDCCQNWSFLKHWRFEYYEEFKIWFFSVLSRSQDHMATDSWEGNKGDGEDLGGHQVHGKGSPDVEGTRCCPTCLLGVKGMKKKKKSSSASRLFFFRTCFYFVVTNDNYFTSVIGLYNRLLLKIGPFKDSGDLKITKSLLENLVFLCSV